MSLYIKLNENTSIGTYWNFWGFDIMSIYNILGKPKDVLTLEYKDEEILQYHRIDDAHQFFKIDPRKYPNFSCMDCHTNFSTNDISKSDRALIKDLFYNENLHIDYSFPSIGNHFAWHTHDGNAYSMVAQDLEHRLFLEKILEEINAIYHWKQPLYCFDSILDVLNNAVKKGIRIDRKSIYYKGGKVYVLVYEWTGSDRFLDMITQSWSYYKLKRLVLTYKK